MRSEGEHHELTESVGLTMRENLNVELAAGRAVGGQLSEQDALLKTAADQCQARPATIQAIQTPT